MLKSQNKFKNVILSSYFVKVAPAEECEEFYQFMSTDKFKMSSYHLLVSSVQNGQSLRKSCHVHTWN